MAIILLVFAIFIKKLLFPFTVFTHGVFCRIFYPAFVCKPHVCNPRTKNSDGHIIGVCELSHQSCLDSLGPHGLQSARLPLSMGFV